MLLAIDIGNTNTVFAVYDGDRLENSWRCRTVSYRSADEYAAFLHEVLSLAKLSWSVFTDVIISSVVPEAERHIVLFADKYLKIKPHIVSGESVSMQVNVARPQDVGADRLVNAVAVAAHYQVPAIVVDFGTATTFDVIDTDEGGMPCYSGGVIAPGINLSMSALQEAAAKLPSVRIEKPQSVIGKDTVSAMQSGIFWGYIGLIEGVCARIQEEMGAGENVFVIATGGLAPLFAEQTPVINTIDPDLTLKGLLEIYKNILEKEKHGS